MVLSVNPVNHTSLPRGPPPTPSGGPARIGHFIFIYVNEFAVMHMLMLS